MFKKSGLICFLCRSWVSLSQNFFFHCELVSTPNCHHLHHTLSCHLPPFISITKTTILVSPFYFVDNEELWWRALYGKGRRHPCPLFVFFLRYDIVVVVVVVLVVVVVIVVIVVVIVVVGIVVVVVVIVVIDVVYASYNKLVL